tara:strand:+ start:429 stop:530 length:102 start_codon:yes stop_codon:yes gene_type:complete
MRVAAAVVQVPLVLTPLGSLAALAAMASRVKWV